MNVADSWQRLRRRYRATKNESLYVAFAFLRFLAGVLPERAGDWVGRSLGLLSYWVLRSRRETMRTNIKLALGWEGPAAGKLARDSFAHLGLLGVEFLRFAGRPRLIRERVVLKDEEHLQNALALGRGVMLLVYHLGNWELLGQALPLHGYRVHPVVQIQANRRFYTVVDRLRREAGLFPIMRGFSLRAILSALRAGDCVVIMPDQDAGRQGVFAPFFGRPASTARGVVSVARLAGAPLVPLLMRRTRPGHHEARFCPPLDLAGTADAKADDLENLGKVNRLLEEAIKECPAQWLWMHRRWKTQPEAGGASAPALRPQSEANHYPHLV